MHTLKVCMVAGLAILLTSKNATAQFCGQFPEIPNPQLPDVGMSTLMLTPAGNTPTIIFNPNITNTIPAPLTAFFRAHEYGHICLGHLLPQYFSGNPYNTAWVTMRYEIDADTYAVQASATMGNIAGIKMAWLTFAQQTYMVPGHPPGPARAANIHQVAASLGIQVP